MKFPKLLENRCIRREKIRASYELSPYIKSMTKYDKQKKIEISNAIQGIAPFPAVL